MKTDSIELANVLDSESQRVGSLNDFFTQLGQELDAIFLTQNTARLAYKDLSPRAQEFVKFVEVGFARGFQEEKIL